MFIFQAALAVTVDPNYIDQFLAKVCNVLSHLIIVILVCPHAFIRKRIVKNLAADLLTPLHYSDYAYRPNIFKFNRYNVYYCFRDGYDKSAWHVPFFAMISSINGNACYAPPLFYGPTCR